MLHVNEGWRVGVGGGEMLCGRRGEEAGAKTSAVRCDMCDEQWRGEEEGQL